MLEDINIQIQQGQKIALIGPNGSGKTTLLRILAGRLEPDSGRVYLAKNCTVGYQSQDFSFTPGNTVLDEGLSVFAPLAAMEEDIRRLEGNLEDERTAERYARSVRNLKSGRLCLSARTRSVLHGLGFGEAELSQPVELLSGGQQSRLARQTSPGPARPAPAGRTHQPPGYRRHQLAGIT